MDNWRQYRIFSWTTKAADAKRKVYVELLATSTHFYLATNLPNTGRFIWPIVSRLTSAGEELLSAGSYSARACVELRSSGPYVCSPSVPLKLAANPRLALLKPTPTPSPTVKFTALAPNTTRAKATVTPTPTVNRFLFWPAPTLLPVTTPTPTPAQNYPTPTVLSSVANGTCSSANGVATAGAPVSGLCAAGNGTNMINNDSAWSWTCAGSGGGLPTSCWAPKTAATTPAPTPTPTLDAGTPDEEGPTPTPTLTPTPTATSQANYIAPVIDYGGGNPSHRIRLSFPTGPAQVTTFSLVSGLDNCYPLDLPVADISAYCAAGSFSQGDGCGVYFQLNPNLPGRCVVQISYLSGSTPVSRFFESVGPVDNEVIHEISNPLSWLGANLLANVWQAVLNILKIK